MRDAPGRRENLVADYLGGCVAGASEVLVGHPLDTIKGIEGAALSFDRPALAIQVIY